MKKKNYVSIKVTIVRILIITGLLFTILLGGILFSVKRIILSISSEYTNMTSKKMESELEMIYEKMDVYAMNVAQEQCVRDLLTDKESKRAEHVKDVKAVIAYYKSLEPAITDIALVNDTIYFSGIYNKEELQEMYQKNQSTSFTWLETRFSSFPSYWDNAQLIYSMPVIKSSVPIGAILISLNTESLEMSGDSIYMLADENAILYNFNVENAEQAWNAWKELGFQNGQKNHYIIQSVYSEKMQCWQISAVDTRSSSGYMGEIKIWIYLCVLLLIVFLVFLIALILKKVIEPLSRFQIHIEKLTENNRYEKQNTEWNTKDQCKEIVKINDAFDHLMDEQKKLNRRIFQTASDLYEAKIQKQEAELSYMRSQIDPHFLYNTLETIRKMALEKNAPEVANMAVDMGKIFRYSTKGEEIVTLQEELEMVKSYLRIQQKRFGDRVQVFYFIPDEAAHCMVMKMILQPVIENAIIHGLEEKETEGSLYIGAKISENTLILTVKDDGVGISEEKLQKINSELEREVYDTSRHVGIINTQARIRLKYGSEYGITVESLQGDGTSIQIKMPAKRGEKDV